MSHPKTLQGSTDSETRAVTPTLPLSHPNIRFFPAVRENTRGACIGDGGKSHGRSVDSEKDTFWGDSDTRDGQSAYKAKIEL